MPLFDDRDLEDRLYKRKVECSSLGRLKRIAYDTLKQLHTCETCEEDLKRKMSVDASLRERVTNVFSCITTTTECFSVIMSLQDKGCDCDSELPNVWQYLDTVEEPHVGLETELANSFQHRWGKQQECQWRKKLSQPYFDMVVKGEKTVEGRLCKGDWDNVKVGDLILFEANDSDKAVVVRVAGITKYDNFTDMLKATLSKALPGMSMSSALSVYNSIYGDEQYDYDVVGLDIAVVMLA